MIDNIILECCKKQKLLNTNHDKAVYHFDVCGLQYMKLSFPSQNITIIYKFFFLFYGFYAHILFY